MKNIPGFKITPAVIYNLCMLPSAQIITLNIFLQYIIKLKGFIVSSSEYQVQILDMGISVFPNLINIRTLVLGSIAIICISLNTVHNLCEYIYVLVRYSGWFSILRSHTRCSDKTY